MRLNVSNIPLNTVYKFNCDSYIIAVMLNETRRGKYRLREPKRFTEIYQNNDGVMVRVVSGEIVDNPRLYNYDRNFAIFDYDTNEVYNFNVDMPLIDVTSDELYKINDILIKEGESRKKKY